MTAKQAARGSIARRPLINPQSASAPTSGTATLIRKIAAGQGEALQHQAYPDGRRGEPELGQVQPSADRAKPDVLATSARGWACLASSEIWVILG